MAAAPEGPSVQLASLRYRHPEGEPGSFPFGLPALRGLDGIDFEARVTLFVGENGTGKSTLLEALAIAADLPAVGSSRPAADPSLAAQARLARCFRLSWRRRTHRGFFLRAEDFFGFQKQIQRARAEHEAELRRIDREMRDASAYARGLAMGPHRGSIAAMSARYGDDPDAASHGEAFLRLFASRLVPDGLFLLDEPEAALSPQSQLGFLAMVKDAVDSGSQFVIATHSPILMAIPGATILSFDDPPPRPVDFEALEPVRLVRDFLASPERFLRLIWEGASKGR